MPTTGDVLLLAKLGRAVGSSVNYTTETKLAADGRGSTGTETKMSQFDADVISNVTSTSNSGIGNRTATMNFSGQGSLFLSRIANRFQNFTWSEYSDNYSVLSISSNQDYTAAYAVVLGPPVSDTITVRCKFHEAGFSDGFNDHVSNYNTNVSFNHSYEGCCFTAGTQVWMVDGSYKNIENIQVDEVIKGTLGNRLLYGFNGGDAFFTPEHPFMTTEGWKAVSPEATISESIEGFDSLSDIGRLEINDVILGSSNVTINSIVSSSANSSLELYNFNVDGDNTYYADNYVVHNKCFVGDTLITMWDETYKSIEEIQVGDKVFTQLGNEEVLEIFSPVHDNILEYTFSDGTKTKNTSDHPYYVVDKGWCSNVPELTNKRYDIVTNEFVCGDICVDDSDEQIELVNIEKLDGEFQTYTFSVNSKTYYANKILVHSEI